MALSKWMQKNQWRTIGEKRYKFYGGGNTKAEAQRKATVYRRKGYNARVVDFRKDGEGFILYLNIPTKMKGKLHY